MKTIIVIKVLLCVGVSVKVYGYYSGSSVEEVYNWRIVTYENLPRSENFYVGQDRYYDPENCDISSMAYHPASGLMIVNVPRLRPGIPATLAAFCVQDYPPGSNPKIWGFPNYEVNALRASDFSEGRYYDDSESRTHHKRKPYKPHHGHHGGQNYYYGNQNYYYQKPYYPKPVPTTSTSSKPPQYLGGHYEHHHYVNQRPYYPPITTTTKKPKQPYDPYNNMRIVSTYLTTVDEKCNRAFTIDVGILNYYGNNTRIIQKPVILVFDLTTDCCETRNFPLARRSEMPDEVASLAPFGILIHKLDYQSNDCDDLFIYITNTFGNYIIVYDYKNDDYWSFTDHPTFQPVIAESHYLFDQTFNYDLPLGVCALALGYQDEYGDRTAFYMPASSTAQFAVSTRILKDKSKAPTNYNPDDFSIMGYRGCGSQSDNMAVDYTYGVLFYLKKQSHRVRCWNMNKPLNPDNIGVIFESEEKFLNGLQIFVDSRGYLWFNSCHLPLLFFSDEPLNLQTSNSRIFRVKVSDAIRGTVCEDKDSYRLEDLYHD